MDTILDFFKEYPIINKVLIALLILLLGRIIAKLTIKALGKVMEKVNIEPLLAKFINNFVYFAVILVSLLIALGNLGIQATSLVALIGTCGLAIGLALQGSLGNFAAGIIIVVFKPFTKGDMIFANGIEGTVEEINIFSTILRDDFNLRHVLPNSMLVHGTITNIWVNKERRLEFNMSIAFKEDLDHVIEVLETKLKAHPLILDKPGPFVGVRSIEHSSVNLMVWVYIHRPNYKMVRFRLYKDMKQALDEQGIVITFPQRDVHLKNVPELEEIAS